ncbi:MAG TPA: methyltransferase domain-containing protein [Candidatus Baltobacteraceae bacterium]|nr:methyltransferase domain-containing protein [Candidatus Baltobacteraceae bacterium]
MPFVSLLRARGARMYADSERLNIENMRAQMALQPHPGDVVDLGCGDGRATLALTSGLNGARVRGIEGHAPFREAARAAGVDAIPGDLDARLPFEDGTIDLVVSNQVIEHLADTDRFVAEIARVLRPGGLAVVSTENMASWHNIAALVFGFQPFSAANYSLRRYPLGNPIGLHAGERFEVVEGMLHRRLFTTRALCELFEAHGLPVGDVRGSGYHPLPPAFGRLNPTHAHFITVAARKPEG